MWKNSSAFVFLRVEDVNVDSKVTLVITVLQAHAMDNTRT